ncbi:MAG: Fur family transcriptional regulator [Carbonactinosporaceae bacterium]
MPSPADRLKQAGLRVTRPRLAVLDALGRDAHVGADAVAKHARESLGSLSTQAVYDILHVFTEVGLVRRIEPAGSPARYEKRVGDNHHHVVCRVCARTVDIDCAVGEAPCLEPSSTQGFKVDEAEVTFWGLCPTCQNRPSSMTAETTRKEGSPA